MRQVLKLINKEWENLEMFKERHDRMKVSSGEPKMEKTVSARYADKLASEAIQSGKNDSANVTPTKKKEIQEEQEKQLLSHQH